MIKLLTTIALVFVTTTQVTAQEEDICPAIGDLAEQVMGMRQDGHSMSKVMGITNNQVAQALIMDAYNQPRYSTDGYKREAVQDFRNEAEAMCYQVTQ